MRPWVSAHFPGPDASYARPQRKQFCLPGFRAAKQILCVAACLAGARAPCRAVEIHIDAGFPDSNSPSVRRYLSGTWIPVSIHLTGPSTAGDAELRLDVAAAQHSTTYVRGVSLHDGMEDDVETFAVAPPQQPEFSMFRAGTQVTLECHLTRGGRLLAEATAPLPLGQDVNAYNLLLLTSDQAGLPAIAHKTLGLLHGYADPASVFPGLSAQHSDLTGLTAVDVLTSDPHELPSQAQGYAMVDAVVLGDLPLDTLTDAQLAAAESYLRRGGTLVVMGGDTARLRTRALAELLPATPDRDLVVPGLPELAIRYHAEFGAEHGMTITAGSPRPGARILLKEGAIPLVWSRPYGAGTILMTAFDTLSPEMRAWKGAAAFWRDLLLCGRPPLLPHTMFDATAGKGYGADSALADALAGGRATRTPAFATVLAFTGFYLFALVPLSYFVLKRLDRRELAWVTAPAIMAAFTLGAYAIGRSIKGGALSANRVVILEGISGDALFTADGMTSVYSAERTKSDIAFGPADGEDAPTELGDGQQGAADLVVSGDRAPILEGVALPLWDTRRFEAPLAIGLAGTVEAKTRQMDASHVEVSVSNSTPYRLEDCVFLSTGEPVHVGTIDAGSTVSRVVQWAGCYQTATSLTLPITPATAGPALRSADPRASELALRAAAADVLGSSLQDDDVGFGRSGPNSGLAPNAFAAWFSAPLMDVLIDGRAAPGVEENLLFVRLPAPANLFGSLALGSDPFLAPPMRKIADSTTGMPTRAGIFR